MSVRPSIAGGGAGRGKARRGPERRRVQIRRLVAPTFSLFRPRSLVAAPNISSKLPIGTAHGMLFRVCDLLPLLLEEWILQRAC